MNSLKLTASINGDKEHAVEILPIVERQLFDLAAFNEIEMPAFIARCLAFATNDADSEDVPDEATTFYVPSDDSDNVWSPTEGLDADNTLRVKTGRAEHTWNMNTECRQIAEPIADEFGMSVEQFLTRLSQNRLQGQLPNSCLNEEFVVEEPPASFKVRGLDSNLRTRIARAAEFDGGVSFENFVFYSVMATVRSLEEEMILSPKTGRIIGDTAKLSNFRSW